MGPAISDYNMRLMILLTVIQLSGGQCTSKALKERFKKQKSDILSMTTNLRASRQNLANLKKPVKASLKTKMTPFLHEIDF